MISHFTGDSNSEGPQAIFLPVAAQNDYRCTVWDSACLSCSVSLCVSLLFTPYCLHSVLQLLTTHPLTQLFVFLFNNDIYMASNLNCSLPLVGK